MVRLIAICLAALVIAAVSTRAEESRPNIIFLLADDLAVRGVACYGNADVHTPHLDRLAADGMRFLNHYDTTSICMASRCSILTGLYEYRHGCNFDHGNLERRFIEKSYPVLLREAGYFTGFAGKVGCDIEGEKFEAFAPLFDQWAGGPGQTFYETAKNEGIAKYAAQYPHCSRAYGAWALDFLKAAKASGKPFCMSISFKAPHMPFTPDPLDVQHYEGRKLSRPANYGEKNGAHLAPQVHTSRAATSYREWMTDFDDTAAKYYALITGVDAAVGMIRDGLEREGLSRNTVIIFTSDNGYNAGSHGFGDKVIPYEEGSRAPLIIYDPRLPQTQKGKTCEAVTGNVDMPATMLALANVSAPAGMDGKTLLPLLSNSQAQVREFLPLFNFWGIDSAQSMAIVTPEWKYIYWYYGGDGMKPTEELFHVGNDRLEMTNSAKDENYSRELESMREHFDGELRRLKERVVQGHGYERYPVLFDRSVGWEEKAPLVKPSRQTEISGKAKGKGKGKARKKQKAANGV